jgi:hypothetical protein
MVLERGEKSTKFPSKNPSRDSLELSEIAVGKDGTENGEKVDQGGENVEQNRRRIVTVSKLHRHVQHENSCKRNDN